MILEGAQMRPLRALFPVVLASLAALLVVGCDTPNTTVTIENAYPPSSGLVIYQAWWSAESFLTPIAPGAASDPQDAIPASANAAYVLLAPGWDPAADGGASPPASLLVLTSKSGFALQLDHALRIPVDDTTFAGRCAAGSPLTQDQADFLTQRVFRSFFVGRTYDAATCTTTVGR